MNLFCFVQAEDGIRDYKVTGVQTCALPIYVQPLTRHRRHLSQIKEKQTMQQSKSDVWVGLFVLIGAAALVFLALQSANLLSLNFQKTYTLTARFDNIGGLKPKAAVRSAGVVVGRVESITFDDKVFQASVTMALENRYAFPKDSSLKILTKIGRAHV